MSNVHVKKDDLVVVTSGKDKNKKGKVLKVITKDNSIIVEGVNVRTKHVKPKKMGEAGGIVKSECAINASKVNLYCSKCDAPRRVKAGTSKDGAKIRVCAKCGEEIK